MVGRWCRFIRFLFNNLREEVFALHKLFHVPIRLNMLLLLNKRFRHFVARECLLFPSRTALNMDISLRVNFASVSFNLFH